MPSVPQSRRPNLEYARHIFESSGMELSCDVERDVRDV
jgi:hypothetical protein